MGMASKHGNRQYDSDYRQTNNDTKEKTVVARTNQGNMKNFNSQINVTMSKLDSDRDNNRLWAPQSTIHNGPSVQTYGKIAQVPQYYNECQGCDRINPDILDSIKNNPYVFSFNSVA
jgi:rRNA maturation endonuclease Nob1